LRRATDDPIAGRGPAIKAIQSHCRPGFINELQLRDFACADLRPLFSPQSFDPKRISLGGLK
jgi:hypothetical protein